MLSTFKRRRYLLPLLMVLVVAGLAVPVFAQEGGAAAADGVTQVNYFGQLFMTDSKLGTGVIWLLILNSTALLSLIMQAFLRNRRSEYIPPDLVEDLSELLANRKYKDAIALVADEKSPFGRIMDWTFKQASRGYEAMEEAMYEMSDDIGNDKIRGLVWMEVAGAAGPMLGLFGTVYGMIMAFTQMVHSSGSPKPAELAGGIATALVCTFWGLVVGIPGVISAAVFRVKIERLSAISTREATRLLSAFRPGASTKPGEESASRSAGRESAPRATPQPSPSASPAKA